MLNNRDLNIDQNNRDYDFCHSRAYPIKKALRIACFEHAMTD